MTMENTCDIIVGLQHGDEGKGKVAHALLKQNEYDYCIRYNGGPNAGHTIQLSPEKSITLHQLPCGVLNKVPSIIGANCVIDLTRLEAEINEVENALPELKGIKQRLYLAHNAHLILHTHIEAEYERHNDVIGTTKRGIGPCYADKASRTGLRVIANKDVVKMLKLKIINIYEHFVENKLPSHILFEGAQGFQLDIDWGDYPYVTSSVVNSYGVYSCGVPNLRVKDIIGCAKIYDTYVGYKKFQNEENNRLLKLIGLYGQEEGSTTGRKRQVNWLNLDELKKALLINNCNYVVVNKCDIIQMCNDKKGTNKLYENNVLKNFDNIEEMKEYIYYFIKEINKEMNIIYSESPLEV
jgi:adenylosuccinate synthase